MAKLLHADRFFKIYREGRRTVSAWYGATRVNRYDNNGKALEIGRYMSPWHKDVDSLVIKVLKKERKQ